MDGIAKLIVWLGVEGLECSTAVEKKSLEWLRGETVSVVKLWLETGCDWLAWRRLALANLRLVAGCSLGTGTWLVALVNPVSECGSPGLL